MMGIICLLLKSIVVFVLLIYLITPTIEATNVAGGFSIDLIHRDSPKSPLFNPYITPLDQYKNGFNRALSRLNHFHNMINSQPQNSPYSEVSANNGQYLMKLSIGTPPVDFYGLADTGSDLMWTQCLPCDQCYKQINPMFDPKSSSSYANIPCQSDNCRLVDNAFCSDSNQNLCNYTYGYGSGALTKGFLAQETITLFSTTKDSSGQQQQQPVSLQNIVFGCGHNTTGGFNEHEMGLIGLGGRPLSLASQIRSQIGSNKFSFCLVPFHTDPNITSKMNFGGEVSGDGVVSTPLADNDDKTYYFVTLEGISVGNNTYVPYNISSSSISKGNVFMDTGTPPILLPQDFYNRLEQEVKKAIALTPYQDPELGTQLCYKSESVIEAPVLTAHFDGGAEVPLIPTSTFIPPKEGVFCFAMHPINGSVGIFGNFAQSNILIGYDLDQRIVSFKPTDCTKQQ